MFLPQINVKSNRVMSPGEKSERGRSHPLFPFYSCEWRKNKSLLLSSWGVPFCLHVHGSGAASLFPWLQDLSSALLSAVPPRGNRICAWVSGNGNLIFPSTSEDCAKCHSFIVFFIKCNEATVVNNIVQFSLWSYFKHKVCLLDTK